MKRQLIFPWFGCLPLLAQAATVTYNFNLTWVYTNPDGLYNRPTIGVNGQWPLPHIEVDLNDHVVVNVQNHLGNRSATLHFHGLYMYGSNLMDGPDGVTQCEFTPGSAFTYEFDVKQPGTYWYHAHNAGQYPDGLRAPFIVHDEENPYDDQIDEELVLTLSDWYHDFMPDLIASFKSVTDPTGAEPIPDSALMNDTHNLHIDVQPGTTYFIRIINVAAFAAQYLWFEGHSVTVIEVDGIYTEPLETDMLYITAAQRYGILLTTKNDTSQNFAIQGSMDQDYFDKVPATLNPNATGWLVYNSSTDLPTPLPVDNFDGVLDDFTLVPYDKEPLYDDVDQSIQLDFEFDNLVDGVNYAFFNGITYISPKVPSLYTALSAGALATNASIYGPNTNAFILAQNDVIELIINSNDRGKHPFHLHGHAMQIAARGQKNDGAFNASNTTLSQVPMRRDTILVNPQSHAVLRFQATNPGVWLFHCHIEWHMDSGLVATMIESPLQLQAQNLSIPALHKDACATQGRPTSGNAAGKGLAAAAGQPVPDASAWMDLSGANTSPAPLPAGFTTSGIVALAFSCLSAFLGLAVVVWYGVGEIKAPKPASAPPAAGVKSE